MFFLATKASSILFAVTISLLVLNSNNGISLLLNHPDIPVFANSESTNNTLVVTHGIASGNVTNDSAVVWSRSNQEAQMHVEYDTNSNFSQPKSTNTTTLNNHTTDYTTHVKLEGLSPVLSIITPPATLRSLAACIVLSMRLALELESTFRI